MVCCGRGGYAGLSAGPAACPGFPAEGSGESPGIYRLSPQAVGHDYQRLGSAGADAVDHQDGGLASSRRRWMPSRRRSRCRTGRVPGTLRGWPAVGQSAGSPWPGTGRVDRAAGTRSGKPRICSRATFSFVGALFRWRPRAGRNSMVVVTQPAGLADRLEVAVHLHAACAVAAAELPAVDLPLELGHLHSLRFGRQPTRGVVARLDPGDHRPVGEPRLDTHQVIRTVCHRIRRSTRFRSSAHA